MDFTGERHIPDMSDKLTEFEHLSRYQAVKDMVNGKKVLDAACGEGYGSFLLSTSATEVIGIDISKESIDHAKKKYRADNLLFLQASVDDMPIANESLDIVVSFETIEHVEEEIQRKFLQEVVRILNRTGRFVISTPDKSFYSDERNYQNPFHKKEFYKEEFIGLLKEYFGVVELFYQRQEVSMVIANESKEVVNHIYSDNFKQNEMGMYLIAVCSEVSSSDDNISLISTGNPNSQLLNYFGMLDEINLYKKELGKLLSLSRSIQIDYLLQFLKYISEDKGIYIWGTGSSSNNTYYSLEEEGYKIHGFIDSNQKTWGTLFFDRKVYSPDSIKKLDKKCFIIIGTSYYQDVELYLKSIGYIKGEDYILGLVM
ncbi:class I SAM-dependent methyltransferase [Paenibacillus sp. MBLB2552]|uniref:Class I SAM-dependent methyltransferase n=1 Tax=Paenibacillus mellifer TaxID=2937794 RepID=A0A9X1Y184_9BACL|nr:class I SAM-dependent methyltransferase [Paenibacillus mellifer]MCK8489042.1 class I SAM-dependent methyltransferase [Paenibacillus mellifer]